MMSSSKWQGLLVCLLFLFALPIGARAEEDGARSDLEVFTRPGCPRCAEASGFLQELRKAQPALRIHEWDVVASQAARERLDALARQQGIRGLGVPAFYLRGRLVVGYAGRERTGAQLLALLNQGGVGPAESGPVCQVDAAPCAEGAESESVDAPLFGRLSVRKLGLPLFTVVIGLLDGFNPCAMWVLLFLLSLLASLHDRRKMLVVGGTFVVVSGTAYFLFMAAWLNVFLFIGMARAVQIGLAVLATLAGAVNVKDFFAFKKGVSLSIPEGAKPGIYRRVRNILHASTLPAALGGVIVLAILVNLVELMCTAGFPALYTQILTLRRLPWWAYYGYLVLYNIFYMLDDSIMLLIAVITLSRRKLQEKEGRWLKLVSGLVMVALGIIMLMRPRWLAM